MVIYFKYFRTVFFIVASLVSFEVLPSQELNNPPNILLSLQHGKVGTGFFVSENGHLLTAYHVIKDRREVWIRFGKDKIWLKAKLIKFDINLDLALIKVDIISKPVSIVSWNNVPVGLEVYVIGFPSVANGSLNIRITDGILNGLISARHRRIDLFQLSAQIQKGSSGAPVFSADGMVIGVVLSKLDALKSAEKNNDLPQNINFALKSSSALSFLDISGVDVQLGKLDVNKFIRPFQVLENYEWSVVPVIGLKIIE